MLPKETTSNIYFLYALLNTPLIRRQILLRSWGTLPSMLHITQEAFLNIDIPLPSEPLQQAFKEKMRLFWEIFSVYAAPSTRQVTPFRSLLDCCGRVSGSLGFSLSPQCCAIFLCIECIAPIILCMADINSSNYHSKMEPQSSIVLCFPIFQTPLIIGWTNCF